MQGTKKQSRDKKSAEGQKISKGTKNILRNKNHAGDKKSAKGQKISQGTENHAGDIKYHE